MIRLNAVIRQFLCDLLNTVEMQQVMCHSLALLRQRQRWETQQALVVHKYTICSKRWKFKKNCSTKVNVEVTNQWCLHVWKKQKKKSRERARSGRSGAPTHTQAQVWLIRLILPAAERQWSCYKWNKDVNHYV